MNKHTLKYLFFILFLYLSQHLQAQEHTVYDKSTGVGIEGAEVFNQDRSVVTYTDKNGKFNASVFAASDTITIRMAGFPDVVSSLSSLGQTILLNDETLRFNIVVFSGSKFGNRSRDLSNKVSIIGTEHSRLQNPQTTADLLGSGGEVFIQKSQLGGGSPMIRGFATNRVLLSVDGIRMNNAIFRSGNLQNVISIDPFTLYSTEVLFGPGTNIYGSDAIGGVMNFTTLKPMFRRTVVHAATRTSTANNEKTGHFDFNIGGKRLAFVGSVTYSDFDDLMMGSRGPDEYLRTRYVRRIGNKDSVYTNPEPRLQIPTGYNQLNVMAKLLYKAGKYLHLGYDIHHSQTSNYARYDRLVRPRNNTLRSAEWDYGPQIWMMQHIKAFYFKKTRFFDDVNLHIALQKFEESRIDRNLNSSTRSSTREKVDASSLNLDFNKKLSKKSRLYYGLEYVHNLVHSTGEETNINSGTVNAIQSRYPDGSTWSSYGIYAGLNRDLSKSFVLNTGVRYSGFMLNSDFDTAFMKLPFTKAEINNSAATGSLGLIYNRKEHTKIAFTISTGFRSPNVDDIGKVFESTPGSVIVPNKDLTAEYATNTELGFSRTFGELLAIDMNVFYTRLNNALVRRSFTLNGQDSIMYDGTLSRVEAVQNAAFATVMGIQAGFRINLPDGFSIMSRYTYTAGEEELDDGSTAPLRHSPPSFGVTHLYYSFKKFKADFYAMYNGEIANKNMAPEEKAKDYIYAKDDEGMPYSPAWTTFNFKMNYQVNDYLSFGAGVENLNDIRYRPYSSGIVAPGRNWIFSLNAKF